MFFKLLTMYKVLTTQGNLSRFPSPRADKVQSAESCYFIVIDLCANNLISILVKLNFSILYYHEIVYILCRHYQGNCKNLIARNVNILVEESFGREAFDSMVNRCCTSRKGYEIISRKYRFDKIN